MQNIESKSDDRIEDNQSNIPENHRELLNQIIQRIQAIDARDATFRSWDVIKMDMKLAD